MDLLHAPRAPAIRTPTRRSRGHYEHDLGATMRCKVDEGYDVDDSADDG